MQENINITTSLDAAIYYPEGYRTLSASLPKIEADPEKQVLISKSHSDRLSWTFGPSGNR